MKNKYFFYCLLLAILSGNYRLSAQNNHLSHRLTEAYQQLSSTIANKQSDFRADPIATFNSPSSNSIGIDYDPGREGFWLACEDGHTYLIDPDDGSLIKDLDLTSIAISSTGHQNGLTVLPSGNILYTDYNGDGGITIDDYLFEIDPDAETLVNYWPLSGVFNTSTDGTSIDNVMDVEVHDGYAWVTNYSDNFLYKIELEPGMPGTWATSTAIPMIHVSNISGIDMFCNTWIIGDFNSTNVVLVDPLFSEISTIDASHDGNTFNSGVCFYDGTDPAQFAVIDWNTDIVGLFDSETSVIAFPSITNIAGETMMCPNEETTLSIEGTLNDAEAWHWYTESCGGTHVYEGESFTTPPIDGEVTFYVRGEGSCIVPPGACEEITVYAVDEEPPQISCPSSTEVYADNTGTYTVPGTGLDFTSTSDNCELQSVTNNYNNLGTLEGAVFPMGSTIVAWTATDEAGNMNNCMFTVQVTDNSSIDELARAGFGVFPNPSPGMLNIQHDFNEVVHYKISDICGKVIYEKALNDKEFNINLNRQKPGVYLLRVRKGSEFFTGKILLE